MIRPGFFRGSFLDKIMYIDKLMRPYQLPGLVLPATLMRYMGPCKNSVSLL